MHYNNNYCCTSGDALEPGQPTVECLNCRCVSHAACQPEGLDSVTRSNNTPENEMKGPRSVPIPNPFIYTNMTYPDGSTAYDDGTIHYPDGAVSHPDGTVSYPDGTVSHPDGAV